MNLYQ